MPNGTLTIHRSLDPWTAFTGLSRAQPGNGVDAVYVDDSGDLRVVFALDPADADRATSFVITDSDGSSTYAEAAFAVDSLDALDIALLNGDTAAALAAVLGNLTTLALAEGADAELTTFLPGLTLDGNDLGTDFVATAPATVNAGDGDDTIAAHPGAVNGSIDGGAGTDLLSFAGTEGKVIVVVGETSTFDVFDAAGAVGTWTFDGIEGFRGSDWDDNFFANSEGMRFEGGAGMDTFYQGLPGGDRDTIDYSTEGGSDGIAVNFGDTITPPDPGNLPADFVALVATILDGEPELVGFNTIRDTFGYLDAVFDPGSFDIVGTAHADFFYGSSNGDVFDGRGGDDRIVGGDGDDTIDGGEGDDAFFLSLGPDDTYSVSYDGGVFTIVSNGFTDTVTGVETLWFGATMVEASSYFPVNAAPVAVDDDNASDPVVEAATGVSGDAGASGNVLANDIDDDDDALSVIGARAGASGALAAVTSGTVIDGVYGSLTISGDGTWSYALDDLNSATNALQAGTTVDEVFTYRISDGSDEDEATLTIAIAGSNDSTAGAADSFTTDEDVSLSVDKSVLTTNDIDPEGETITLISVQGASNGSVALVGSTVVFTPDAGFHGNAGFAYTAAFSLGGTLTRQVSVSVNSVDDAPTSADRIVAVMEDGTYTFSSADFGFTDQDSGDTLKAVVIASLPGSGTLSHKGALVLAGQSISVADLAQLTFRPPANASGTPFAAFSFKVSDGVLLSAQHTLKINVTSVNDAPIAQEDQATTAEDTPVILSATALLANDIDADTGATLWVASVTSGPGGSVVLNSDGTVTFTPLADFNGSATFSYRATDGVNQSDSAIVKITVQPVDDAPAVSGLSEAVAVAEGTMAVSTVAGTDVDGDALSFSIFGTDADLFEISSVGALRFRGAPDFERPADADHDNAYEVSVVVAGDSSSTVASAVVTVTDVDGSTIFGNGKNNTIDKSHPFKGALPGSEEDTIDGRKGDDKLNGAAGDDTLIGGKGADTLVGAAGSDRFVFSAKLDGTNVDKVKDFVHGTDEIALDDGIFQGLGVRLKPRQFHAGDGAVEAHDRNDRIIYDSRSGKLYFDDDGNRAGGHEAVHFATLTSKPLLDAGDFAIV